MSRSKFAIGVYVLLVFLSGAAVGAFGHRLYMVSSVMAGRTRTRTSPEEYRKKYTSEMRTRLKLSEAQVTQLNQILDETRSSYREFHERTRPELKAIQQKQVDKVNEMLDPVQRAEYTKMRDEREKSQKNEKGHSGGY